MLASVFIKIQGMLLVFDIETRMIILSKLFPDLFPDTKFYLFTDNIFTFHVIFRIL